MTRFVERLLSGGNDFRVTQNGNVVTLKPRGSTHDDLKLFQPIVELARRNEGDGYEITMEHPCSDHGYGLIDLLLIQLHPEMISADAGTA